LIVFNLLDALYHRVQLFLTEMGRKSKSKDGENSTTTMDRRLFHKRMRKDKKFRSMMLTFLMEYLIEEVNQDNIKSDSDSDSSDNEPPDRDDSQEATFLTSRETSIYTTPIPDIHKLKQALNSKASHPNANASTTNQPISRALVVVSRFCLFDLSDYLFESQCRFSKNEVIEIANRLFASETVPCVNGDDGQEEIHRHDALALVLARLAHNLPLSHLAPLINRGWTNAWTQRVITSLFSRLHEQFQTLLFWDYKRLTCERLDSFAHALKPISGRDCLMGFIECYFRPMCCSPTDDNDITSPNREPSKEVRFSNQHLFYQVIFTPDGLISSLFGPAYWQFPSHLLEVKSKMYMLVNDLFKGLDGRQLKYYCDRFTYFSTATETEFRPQRNLPLTEAQKGTNRAMSMLRGIIERRAKTILSDFSYLSLVQDDKNENFTSLSNIYATAILLTNCKICLDQGNREDNSLLVSPPTLDEYLCNAVSLNEGYDYEECLPDPEELAEGFIKLE
jgi:hypothetical protein